MPKFRPGMCGAPDPEFDIIELLAATKHPLTFTEIRTRLGEFTNYQYMIPKEYFNQYLVLTIRAGMVSTGFNADGSRVFWYAKEKA